MNAKNCSGYKTVASFKVLENRLFTAESQTERIFCLFLTCCQPLQFDMGLNVAVVLWKEMRGPFGDGVEDYQPDDCCVEGPPQSLKN